MDAKIVLAPKAGHSKGKGPPPTGDEILEGRVVFPDGEPVARGWATVPPLTGEPGSRPTETR